MAIEVQHHMGPYPAISRMHVRAPRGLHAPTRTDWYGLHVLKSDSDGDSIVQQCWEWHREQPGRIVPLLMWHDQTIDSMAAAYCTCAAQLHNFNLAGPPATRNPCADMGLLPAYMQTLQ